MYTSARDYEDVRAIIARHAQRRRAVKVALLLVLVLGLLASII